VHATVGEVMTRRVVAATEGAEFKQIAAMMRANRVSALPVVDSRNRVIGVVSEADLLLKQAAAAPQRASWRSLLPATERKADAVLAKDLMTRPAVTIGRDATVSEAAAVMSAHRVKRLPVVDGTDHLVGVISRVDVLSVFGREDSEIRGEIIHDVIAGNRALSPEGFEVSVTSGIVTITGQVTSKAVADQLMEAIRQVDGAVTVRDRLTYPHEDPGEKGKFFPFNVFTPKG
jgi:CBS domain-containing protein